MAGLFDALQGMMGRADPQQQLYAAMGQGPGQPGSPQGPQPLAGQNAPPGGPAGPGGSPDPSGGPSQPQQQPQAPPQPQAYQSPPDLAQMFMALSQRDQQRQQFNSGLAGLAKALYPGRTSDAWMKTMTGGGEDTGSMFNNLVQLQQSQQQNQALQAYRQGVPGMLKGMGLSDDEIKAYTPLALADPSFATKIAENQLGVGGGPAWMAQKHAEKALTDAGKPIPWTPGDPSSYNAWNAVNIADKKQAGEDIGNAKDSFAGMNANYTNMRDNMDWLMNHQDAVVEALTTVSPTGGLLGKGAGAVGAVSQDAQTAAQKLALMKQQLYASNFRGTKQRLAASEATRLGDQFTTLNAGALNMSPGDIKDELGRLSDQMGVGHANVIASAGQELPADLADKADKIYTDPTSSLYAYGNKPVQVAKAPPAKSGGGGGGGGGGATDLRTSKDPDGDYNKLPSEAVFIAPDGQQRRKP